MQHGIFSFSAVSPEIELGQPLQNAATMAKQVELSNRSIVVFPALGLSGSTVGELFFENKLLSESQNALAALCRKTADIDRLILVGLALDVQSSVCNVQAVIYKGKPLCFVTQQALPMDSVICYGERVPVGQNLVVSVNGGDISFAPVVATDFYEGLSRVRQAAKSGAAIVCYSCAAGYYMGAEVERKQALSAISKEYNITVIFSNAGAGESTGECAFAADNFAVQCGELLAEAPLFGDGLIKGEADAGWTAFQRRRNGFTAQSATTISVSMGETKTELVGNYSRHPLSPAADYPVAKNIIAAQAAGLRQRIKSSGCKALLLGLSGGLDSAMSAIASKAATEHLDDVEVYVYSLPCFGTGKRTRGNSARLAECLGLNFQEVDISAAVKQMLADMGHDGVTPDLAFENAQARVRAMFLLNKANSLGGIVVGTGDLSEEALGFCTFGGDSLFNYGVNASVSKTLIRHLLTQYIEQVEPQLAEVIKDILDTPVSPELLPVKEGDFAQKTEDIVGPYELHDFFIYHKLKRGSDQDKILRVALKAFDGVYDEQTLTKWLNVFGRRFYVQQFKRSAAPEGVAVTDISLSQRTGGYNLPGDIPQGYSVTV